MAEFTDTANAADNTGFSDSLGDATTSTPQGIPDSTATTNTGDSPPTPPDTTGTDTAITGDTATPTDSTQDSTGDAVSNTPEEQDIYILLQQLQTERQEYQTQVLETAQTLTDQAKNTLSCLVLTIVLIGFLSGLVLARSVWRKF